MTKAEKAGITLAIISLLISISTPIATFYWLDPNLKAFKDRGRLQVSQQDDGKYKKYSEDLSITLMPTSYRISVLNIGKLPAKDIQIVLQFSGSPPSSDFFTFTPPLQYELHKESHQCFISLKRPLASQDSLDMNFTQVPSTITVSTDSGETNVISSPYDFTGIREKEAELNSKMKSKEVNPKKTGHR